MPLFFGLMRKKRVIFVKVLTGRQLKRDVTNEIGKGSLRTKNKYDKTSKKVAVIAMRKKRFKKQKGLLC